MNKNRTSSGVSAPKNCRQNWVTSLMLVTALALTGVLHPAVAFAQPAAPTPPALQQAIIEVEAEMGVPSGPMPVPVGQCTAPAGMTCLEFELNGATLEVPSPASPTQEQVEAAISAAECRVTQRQRILARALRRLTRRVQVGEVSESAFLGIPADATPDQRIAAAHYWGRYLRETIPAQFAQAEYDTVSGDAAVRAEFQEGLRLLREHVNAEVARLQGLITAETTRATGAEASLRTDLTTETTTRRNEVSALSARLDRHTIGAALALEGAFMRGSPLIGATARGRWRTGGFFLQVDIGGLYSSELATGTFTGGGQVGAAFDAGNGSVDVGGYARTLQLPEDRVGSRTGRLVQSAGALGFEGGVVARYLSARRGVSFLGELRIGVADPAGDTPAALVGALGVGIAWHSGL